MLILDATDRKAARSVAGVNGGTATGTAAVEVQAARARPIYRATPVAAVRACRVERPIAMLSVAHTSPFERGGKSPTGVVAAPT